MQKFNSRLTKLCFFNIFIFILSSQIIGSRLVASNNIDCQYNEIFSEYELDDDDDDIEDSENLGQFAEIYEHIEQMILCSEENNDCVFLTERSNFISKSTKKVSRYILTKVRKLLCSFVNTDRVYTLDDVAYRVAKFKHHMDRIYNTGSLDDIFSRM
jgi:hypothetical protein